MKKNILDYILSNALNCLFAGATGDVLLSS